MLFDHAKRLKLSSDEVIEGVGIAAEDARAAAIRADFAAVSCQAVSTETGHDDTES